MELQKSKGKNAGRRIKNNDKRKSKGEDYSNRFQ